MKHYSPSSLGNIFLCSRWTPDDVSNEAADNGTSFHDDMEKLILGYKPAQYEEAVNNLERRGDEHKQLVRAALAEAGPFLCLGLPVHGKRNFTYADNLETIEPGVYVECSVELWPDDRKHKVGRIDCLVVPRRNHAVIIDWKSNMADSDFSWQLDSYAGALTRLCKEPWQQLIGKIVAPRLREPHEDIVYTPADVKRTEHEITVVEERANNPFSPPCPGEKQCKYCRCRRLGQCPAHAQVVTDQVPTSSEIPADVVVEKDTNLVLYDQTVLETMSRPKLVLHPKTLEQRALRRDWCSIVTMIADYIKEDDKAYFQSPEHESESLPGYKVSTRDGNRQLDKTKLMEFNRSLMGEFGLDYDTMLTCLVPNKELLCERLALKLGTKKAAESRYDEVADCFSTTGAPITTIRRDVSRKLVKMKVNKDNQ